MVGSLWGWVEIFFGEEVEFGVGAAVLDGSVDLNVEALDGALDGGERVGTLLLVEELAPEEIKHSVVIGNDIFQGFQNKRGIPFFQVVLTFCDISELYVQQLTASDDSTWKMKLKLREDVLVHVGCSDCSHNARKSSDWFSFFGSLRTRPVLSWLCPGRPPKSWRFTQMVLVTKFLDAWSLFEFMDEICTNDYFKGTYVCFNWFNLLVLLRKSYQKLQCVILFLTLISGGISLDISNKQLLWWSF